MVKFAFRNLFRHKMRTAMTLAAIMLGVAAIVVSGGFVKDIFIQLRDATIHSRLGYLQVNRTGYYELGRRDPFAYLIKEPNALTRELEGLPHVTDVLKRLNFTGLLNNGRTDRSIIGEGVEPAKEARLGTYLTMLEGRQLQEEDAYGVLLGEGVAKSLQLEPGDYATLLVNTAAGAMNVLELQVIGVFRTFSKDYDARAVRLPLTTAQELLDTNAVHSLVFSLDAAQATDSVARAVRAALPNSEFEVLTWRQLDDFYRKTVALYQRQFGVLQVIILGIVLLSVSNSVNMTAYERIGEFGTLRALGRRRRYVFGLIVLENTLLGALGASIGVAAGVLLAWSISAVGIPMPPPPNANSGYTAYIRIVPAVLGTAFLVGFIATVLSSLFAARGASGVPIAEALRENM